jgi:hypothetical protein
MMGKRRRGKEEYFVAATVPFERDIVFRFGTGMLKHPHYTHLGLRRGDLSEIFWFV